MAIPKDRGHGDHGARLIETLRRAEVTLGDRDKAEAWMQQPNRALGGRRPADVLQDAETAPEVLRILGRIAHGVHS